MPIVQCELPDGGKGFRWGAYGHCYPMRAGAEKQAAAAHASGFHGDEAIAFDKASVRTVDTDGRMHVSVTPISKGCVNGYYGREIPNAQELGLLPDQMYQLLRDPEELKKAAPTFNNLPLLRKHVRTTAKDPQKDDIVGTTGSTAEFKEPYLLNSLAIWDAVAIAGVLTEEQCQLSSSYHYVAVMEPGEYKGEKFDGKMTQIRGNHVALVENGRAGPDVVVGDSKPTQKKEFNMPKSANALSRKALFAYGALNVYLQPKLAQDQKVDIAPLFKGVTSKNYTAKQDSIVKGLAKLCEGKLAEDASIDDVVDLLGSVGKTETGEEPDPMAPADPVTGDNELGFLEGKISPEDMAKLCEIMKAKTPTVADADGGEEAAAAAAKKAEEDNKGGAPMMKPAMDAAIKTASDKVRAETIAQMNAIREAERIVRPYIGEVVTAMDSAEDVYKLALDAAAVNLEGVPPAAYKAMVGMLPQKGSEAPAKKATLAADAAAIEGFAKRYPNASRLRSV